MSYASDYADSRDVFAIDAVAEERAAFIRRTYMHLGGAVVAFILIEAALLNSPVAAMLMQALGQAWWAALLGFMVVAWVAQRWAHTATTPAMQYTGLALYTIAEAVIFVPLLMFAQIVTGDSQIIMNAGVMTLSIFAGLTLVVMISGADFSFLRNFLWMGTIAGLAFIVASMFLPITLGLIFCSLMVVLFAGWILYDTSNVLHHYRTDQHVGAALELFASLATLFWYILRLAIILSDD